jgi:hypothetical protein
MVLHKLRPSAKANHQIDGNQRNSTNHQLVQPSYISPGENPKQSQGQKGHRISQRIDPKIGCQKVDRSPSEAAQRVDKDTSQKTNHYRGFAPKVHIESKVGSTQLRDLNPQRGRENLRNHRTRPRCGTCRK